MNILKVFQFGKGVQAEIEDATKPIQTATGLKAGYKTTEWWGKNLVQIVALGGIAYGLRTGHSLTPEQEAAIVHFGMIVIAAVEVIYNLARSWVKITHSFGQAIQDPPKLSPPSTPAPAYASVPISPPNPPTPPTQ